MIEFLTTSATASRIEAIVRKADCELVLVSPYLQFSDTFVQRLQDADRRGVEIYVIYGKDELHPAAREALAELTHLRLFFCDNLHAKCYFNQEAMVITSMNLYEYSEKNNREMGVWVTNDEEVYQDAMEETRSINAIAEEQYLRSSRRRRRSGGSSARRGDGHPGRDRTGHCIRCDAPIPHRPDAPYCRSCFSVWVQWEDPEYREHYCHTCGRSEGTSMLKPQCYSCYRN